MARLKQIALLLLVAGLAACQGGGFIPQVGPYTGSFMVEDTAIGTLSVTAADGLLTGTGTLTHNSQVVDVSVSALIQDRTINGTVSNAALGSGAFTGQFSGTRVAFGEFAYTDSGAISTTTGTWRVEMP